ncbi:MAG TPA: DNA polymerase/3'-5' exonuclease PolX, partial [Candidatus Omnitrophota bacterium]|nr:DNA polymerase/3'-5' exonuclease PolX [Candidatus Omnitrophota bacterium]
MENREIAQVLEEIAEFLEIKGDNPFKIRAYHNGARLVEGLAEDIRPLAESGRLATGEIKGIGIGLAEKISELVKTGKCKYHEELKRSLPRGVLNILQIPGLGPKRAKVLYEKLGVKDVAELEYACQENRLISLDGFGEKSQARVLEAIKHYNKSKGYFLIAQALEESAALVKHLKKSKEAIRIEVAGSVRRHNEIVHDVDILASAKNPTPIHRLFTSYSKVDQVLAKGETKSSVILKSGLQADLRTVSDKEFPYALYYFTGSKEHNVATRTIAKRRGLKISEYGIFKGRKLIPCKTEADLFKVLKLNYIPPELRENQGEIEIAEKGEFPHLIETTDIKGIFHVHSDYSDGIAPLEAMVARAGALGYDYVGISDHSKSATYANGLSEERVKKQHRELDRIQKKFQKIRIFRGVESDILQDGSLDYSDRVLESFDFVIGSIHSRFQMSEKEMTKRICRAMEHPKMTIWGHPTGRLLLGRSGYAVNFDAVFETARKNNVVIEINANPQRLDLDWRLLRAAKAKRLRFAINPDAHSVSGLDDVAYGVGIARKGWLEKK